MGRIGGTSETGVSSVVAVDPERVLAGTLLLGVRYMVAGKRKWAES